MTIAENAYLKLERADEQIREINQYLLQNPPFGYALETDFFNRTRALFALKHDLSLKKLVIRCGEALHNIRSALDQLYWELISPAIPPEKHKAVYFPISKDEESLEQTIKSRLGHSLGDTFFLALKSLNCHLGNTGNRFLCLLHEINIDDKHKFPVPAGNFTRINSVSVQQQVPDFPNSIVNGGFGRCKKDVVWPLGKYKAEDLQRIVPPTTDVFLRELDLPVETWLFIDRPEYSGEIIETLRNIHVAAKEAIDTLVKAVGK